MSAISGYISTIRNAVYGEQVRTAIVNALEACYSDVESPSLNQAAFTAAINAAYAGGILDIVTVTSFNSMTNQNIIYRYNGTAAGKQKGLYYYSALSSSWVLIGSEIQKVTLLSQMTDVNDIYKYIGTESGMVQNSLYCHNGTSWVPIGSGVLTASTAARMTNTDAIYKYTGTQSGYYTNVLYYYNGTEWTPINPPTLSLSEIKGVFHSGYFNAGSWFDFENRARQGNRLYSDIIYIEQGATIYSEGEYTFGFAEYKDKGVTTLLKSQIIPITNYTVTASGYFIFSILKNYNSSDSSADPISAEEGRLYIDGEYEQISFFDGGQSLGVRWRANRMRQICSFPVYNTGVYPLMNGPASVTENPLVGIPYSAATRYEGYVGTDVSMYTYLAAVKNPQSVIYTKAYNDYYAHCYYGDDCSGMLNGGNALHDNITTGLLKTCGLYEVIDNFNELQVGDGLWMQGHCSEIIGLHKDKYGRIMLVEFADEWTPYPRHKMYRWNELMTFLKTNGYNAILRYKNRDVVELSPSDTVFFEDLENATFPDIIADRGDKFSSYSGEDISFHVMDSDGYSSIEVKKDGTTIDTKPVADFTLSNPSDGNYEVKLVGTNKTSSCYFHVGTINFSISGNTLTFSATNSFKPYSISAYKADPKDGNGNITAFSSKQIFHLFTAEELASGTCDISDLLTYINANNGYIKLKAYTDYGTIYYKYQP